MDIQWHCSPVLCQLITRITTLCRYITNLIFAYSAPVSNCRWMPKYKSNPRFCLDSSQVSCIRVMWYIRIMSFLSITVLNMKWQVSMDMLDLNPLHYASPTSLSLSLFLSLFLSLSVSVLSVCLSLAVCLSFSLSLSVSVFLFVCLSFSLCSQILCCYLK